MAWLWLAVQLATPLSILLFLTCFLVHMARGRYDTRFTRFCDRAMVPSGILTIGLIAATLRWF